jgi:hypothetical protein
MPTAQVNGTPTTSSSTNNNSNTIKTIGVGYNVGVYGSKVVEGLVSEKSKSAGTFAHDHVLPLTFAVTDELAGVPTSVMSTNGYDHENIRNPARRFTFYVRKTSTSFRAGDFNIYSGKFNPDPVVTIERFAPLVLPNWMGSSNVRKYPGPMTFLVNGRVPTTVTLAGNTAQ